MSKDLSSFVDEISEIPGELVRVSRPIKAHAFEATAIMDKEEDLRAVLFGNPRIFLSGLLSSASQEIMTHRLRALSNEFNQLHRQDNELTLEKRKNMGILVAMREWEFSALKGYLK